MTTFTKKAIGFTQTDRTGWTLNMTVDDIIQMAPAREPEQLAFNILGETNRPITSRHLESIERFLEETPDWAVPAIILAADPGNVSEKSGRITAEMDEIRILDGQHRIQAFSNVVHEMQIATAGRTRPETPRSGWTTSGNRNCRSSSCRSKTKRTSGRYSPGSQGTGP